MRKIFELARAYPIESVALIGSEGFAVCSGADRYLEEWRMLAEPVMGRTVIPLCNPATTINSFSAGTYCCQNLDTLMLVAPGQPTQFAELTNGVICSRTVSLANKYIHITSDALLKTYTSTSEDCLVETAFNKIPIA